MGETPRDPASPTVGAVSEGADLRRAHSARQPLVETVIASWLLLASMPLWALIALAIRLESPGSAIYIDDRVGLGGDTFRIMKFRTMKHQCEDRPEKLSHDDRVTRVGRFLRRSSLDELPQLVNVVNGSMTFVGPRPETIDNLKHYRSNHYPRFDVFPGMTGLWQVSGRSNLSLQQKLEIDLQYVAGRSIWLNAKIMMRTPLAVISGRGAY